MIHLNYNMQPGVINYQKLKKAIHKPTQIDTYQSCPNLNECQSGAKINLGRFIPIQIDM